MTRRTGTGIAALALVLAACSGGAESADTTTTAAPPSTSATTAGATTPPTTAATTGATEDGPSVPSGSVAPPEPSLLTYRFEPDSSLRYAIDLEQNIQMHADGDDPEAIGEDEFPVDADLRLQTSSTMNYEVFPGPTDDTYEIVITADFDDVSVTGTVNGESPDAADQDDLTNELTTLEAISTSVIVDESGAIISVDGESLDFLGGGVGALGGLATDDLGRPVGPTFPTDRELAVGDSWSETSTEEGLDGEAYSSTVTHTVIDAQDVGGATTLVIESVTQTDAIDIDFTEFFRAFFGGFASLGGEGEEGELPPEMQEMLDQLIFLISIEPTVSTATTWFDPDSGLVRRSESDTSITISMEFRGPNDETGQLVGFELDMTLEQSVTLALLDEDA